MDEQISDARLQIMLRNHIENTIEKDPLMSGMFNSFLNCGKKFNPNSKSNDVILITNGKRGKLVGTLHCNSPWYCPHCSAVEMSKHASRIATAIEALKRQGQAAIMVTFTIPHHRGYSCNEVTEILVSTWKDFINRGNKKQTKTKYFKGTNRTATYIHRDVFSLFNSTLNCIHRVRVIEYTYGANGWHPHIHCLFWLPKKNAQDALIWEHDLRMRWLQLAEKHTLKILAKRKNFSEDAADAIHQYFDKTTPEQDARRDGVHISDNNGKIIIQQSSQYICGWGADRELTGNYKNKASKAGHMSPHQILTAAYEATESTEREKWLNIYLEYMITTRTKHLRRVQFSRRTGIIKIIEAFRKTEEYVQTFKKKFTEQDKWQVVCWFNSKQWSEILLSSNKYLIAEIIERAHLPDAREQITELLLKYDIDIRNNDPLMKQSFIEKYFNTCDYKEAA